jgi:hypothetical protein
MSEESGIINDCSIVGKKAMLLGNTEILPESDTYLDELAPKSIAVKLIFTASYNII